MMQEHEVNMTYCPDGCPYKSPETDTRDFCTFYGIFIDKDGQRPRRCSRCIKTEIKGRNA